MVRLMVGLRANFHRSGGGGDTRGDVAFLKRGAHTKLSSRVGQGVGWEAKYQLLFWRGAVRWGSIAFLKMRYSLELLWGEGIEC